MNARRIEVGGKMSLEEIREAYGEILRAYNELFPLHPEKRIESDDVRNGLDSEEEAFCSDAFRKKATEVLSRLKKVADRSGNAQIWHVGESLDNLNQGMRERIEKAIRSGI
jgi:hypothetical protein